MGNKRRRDAERRTEPGAASVDASRLAAILGAASALEASGSMSKGTASRDLRWLCRALAKAGAPPEVVYAAEMTGHLVTEQARASMPRADLEEWDEAVKDYRHQARTGIIPLTPDDMLLAWQVIRAAAEPRDVIPIRVGGQANTLTNRVHAALVDALGSADKAAAAMGRTAALVELCERVEFRALRGSDGYDVEAVLAASWAEIDPKHGAFRVESFRRSLATLLSQ